MRLATSFKKLTFMMLLIQTGFASFASDVSSDSADYNQAGRLHGISRDLEIKVDLEKATYKSNAIGEYNNIQLNENKIRDVLAVIKPINIDLKVESEDVYSPDDKNIITNNLNIFLGSLRTVNVESLTLQGNFDTNSVAYIGNLTNLKKLSFDDEDTSIECRDYSPWSNLVNLTCLEIKNRSFSEKPLESEDGDIPFKSFVNILSHLTKLNTLDLSNNIIFPGVRTSKDYSGRGKKKKLERYMNWRKDQITECAQALATNYHGKSLLMEDTKLGEIFINAYTDQLIKQKFSPMPEEINFSNNYIPLKDAAYFTYRLRKKNITVYFSKNRDIEEKKSRIYEAKDITDYILTYYVLKNITLKVENKS